MKCPHKFRKGAVFVLRPEEYFSKLSNDDKNAVLNRFFASDNATRRKGTAAGVFGMKGERILRIMLYRIHNAATGTCRASYATICRLARCSRQTLAKVLAECERRHVFKIIRTIERRVVNGVSKCVQGVNIYRPIVPRKLEDVGYMAQLRDSGPAAKKPWRFPEKKPPLLAWLPGMQHANAAPICSMESSSNLRPIVADGPSLLAREKVRTEDKKWLSVGSALLGSDFMNGRLRE